MPAYSTDGAAVKYGLQALGIIQDIVRHAVLEGRLPAHFPSAIVDDLQALADVRTLDEWEAAADNNSARRSVHLWRTFRGEVTCELRDGSGDEHFGAKKPDEARAKAAAWVREQAKLQPHAPASGDDQAAPGGEPR